MENLTDLHGYVLPRYSFASAKLKTVILVLTSFRNPPSRSLTRVLTKFLMFMFAHFGIGPSTCFQTPFFLLTLFGMPSTCTSTTAALLFVFFMNLGLEIVSGTYKYVVYIIFWSAVNKCCSLLFPKERSLSASSYMPIKLNYHPLALRRAIPLWHDAPSCRLRSGTELELEVVVSLAGYRLFVPFYFSKSHDAHPTSRIGTGRRRQDKQAKLCQLQARRLAWVILRTYQIDLPAFKDWLLAQTPGLCQIFSLPLYFHPVGRLWRTVSAWIFLYSWRIIILDVSWLLSVGWVGYVPAPFVSFPEQNKWISPEIILSDLRRTAKHLWNKRKKCAL